MKKSTIALVAGSVVVASVSVTGIAAAATKDISLNVDGAATSMRTTAATVQDVLAAREAIKDVMGLWRQECPEYSFMVDCLYLFSEKMEVYLTGDGQ